MTKIEKIARAIDTDIWTDHHWIDAGIVYQEQYEAIRRKRSLARVRAVLEALREPTEDMVEAGATAEGDGNLGMQARNIWTAMLDAILKEGT